MKWDKYTVLSQEAFQLAQQKAEELGHQEIKPEHLLIAFLEQEENIVNSILAKIGISHQKVTEELEDVLAKMPKVEGGGEIYLSSEQIQDNAEQYGTQWEEELYRVLIHGCLHLCGHEDDTPAAKAGMTSLENTYLNQLGGVSTS